MVCDKRRVGLVGGDEPSSTLAFYSKKIRFPSCWNGVDLYKKDQSHMAYPIGGESGPCPATHTTRLVTIFYEVSCF